MPKGGKSDKKKEFEELFNKIFGVNVKWSKLSLEELTQIATVLMNPDSLIKKLQALTPSNTEKMFLEGLKKMLSAIGHRGPLIDALRRILGVPATEEGETKEVKK